MTTRHNSLNWRTAQDVTEYKKITTKFKVTQPNYYTEHETGLRISLKPTAKLTPESVQLLYSVKQHNLFNNSKQIKIKFMDGEILDVHSLYWGHPQERHVRWDSINGFTKESNKVVRRIIKFIS